MNQSHNSETNRRLGYPDDARLLIINADDFGMCHATNEAIFRSITEGAIIGSLPFDTTVDVVGRSADGAWIQVNYQGQSGWVSSQFGHLSDDLNKLPVTG